MNNQEEQIEDLQAAAQAADAAAALAAENEELRQAIRLQQARDAVMQSLSLAGARSPTLLFETAKGRLQFSDDGVVTNAAAIAAEMRKEYPEQFAAAAPTASIDGGAGLNQPAMLTKGALAKMSPAEIAALDWNVVKSVLSK